MIWESGHHQHFCSSSVSLQWFGGSKSGHHLGSLSSVLTAVTGTWKEQGWLDMSLLSSSSFYTDWESVKKTSSWWERHSDGKQKNWGFIHPLNHLPFDYDRVANFLGPWASVYKMRQACHIFLKAKCWTEVSAPRKLCECKGNMLPFKLISLRNVRLPQFNRM